MTNGWLIEVSPLIEVWVAECALIAKNRAHDWTVHPRGDHPHNTPADTVDVLWRTALDSGQILIPAGIDVWVEYASEFSIQVYVCLTEDFTGDTPVTTVSPTMSLASIDTTSAGPRAAAYALASLALIATQTLDALAGSAAAIRAHTSTDRDELRGLGHHPSAQVAAAVAGNPAAEDTIQAWTWLRANAETNQS